MMTVHCCEGFRIRNFLCSCSKWCRNNDDGDDDTNDARGDVSNSSDHYLYSSNRYRVEEYRDKIEYLAMPVVSPDSETHVIAPDENNTWRLVSQIPPQSRLFHIQDEYMETLITEHADVVGHPLRKLLDPDRKISGDILVRNRAPSDQLPRARAVQLGPIRSRSGSVEDLSDSDEKNTSEEPLPSETTEDASNMRLWARIRHEVARSVNHDFRRVCRPGVDRFLVPIVAQTLEANFNQMRLFIVSNKGAAEDFLLRTFPVPGPYGAIVGVTLQLSPIPDVALTVSDVNTRFSVGSYKGYKSKKSRPKTARAPRAKPQREPKQTEPASAPASEYGSVSTDSTYEHTGGAAEQRPSTVELVGTDANERRQARHAPQEDSEKVNTLQRRRHSGMIGRLSAPTRQLFAQQAGPARYAPVSHFME